MQHFCVNTVVNQMLIWMQLKISVQTAFRMLALFLWLCLVAFLGLSGCSTLRNLHQIDQCVYIVTFALTQAFELTPVDMSLGVIPASNQPNPYHVNTCIKPGVDFNYCSFRLT